MIKLGRHSQELQTPAHKLHLEINHTSSLVTQILEKINFQIRNNKKSLKKATVFWLLCQTYMDIESQSLRKWNTVNPYL